MIVRGLGVVQCKLCDRDVETLVNSHIIPKSFYGKAFKDPGGPARIFSSNQGIPPIRSLVGEYDRNLLCHECEASLSKFDDYAHKFLFQTSPSQTIIVDAEPHEARFDQVDTGMLRIFFVSLLWRMHATERSMFRIVKLAGYAPRFKLATLEKNPDLVPEMDVVISKFDNSDTPVMGPRRQRFDGVNGYHVSFAGGTCWIKVDNRRMPRDFAEVALSRGSPVHVVLRDFSESPEHAAMRRLVLQRPK